MGRAVAIVRSGVQAPRALLTFVARRDHNLMTRLNGWRPPRWFRLWMICATRGGDGWLWYTMGVCLLLFGGVHAGHAVLSAGVAAGTGVACFIGLKRTFRRRRPSVFASHCWTDLLPPDQFSFPSGHTITAFSVAVCLSLYFPALAAGLFFCAVSVAISRVVLGMHFLSDVIAGSIIGVLLGYAAFLTI
jgi:undecaprenyl-diphosphatase